MQPVHDGNQFISCHQSSPVRSRSFFQSSNRTLEHYDLSFTEIRYLASDLCNVALSFLGTTDTHALNFPLNDLRFKQLEKFLNNIVIYHLQKLYIWPVICATLDCLTLVLPTPVP